MTAVATTPDDTPGKDLDLPGQGHHNGQARTVDTVIVDKEIIFERGHFTRFDAAGAYRRIDATAALVERRMTTHAEGPWPVID